MKFDPFCLDSFKCLYVQQPNRVSKILCVWQLNFSQTSLGKIFQNSQSIRCLFRNVKGFQKLFWFLVDRLSELVTDKYDSMIYTSSGKFVH